MGNSFTALERAVENMLQAANELCIVLDDSDPENDPYAAYVKRTVDSLRDTASRLLPPNEGWPPPIEGEDGVKRGVVLSFIPRQTG